MKKTLSFLLTLISITLFSDVIELPKKPDVPQWKAELVQETELEDIQSFVFDQIYKNDKVYLADSKQPAVVVYDLNGEYVKTIGCDGEGPGEFRNVCYLWDRSDKNYLVVYDENLQKLSHFDYEGHFLETEALADLSKPSKKRVFQNGLVIESGEIFFDKVPKNKVVVQIQTDEINKTIYEVAEHPFLLGWYNYKKPYFAVSDDKIYLIQTSRDKYELQIYNKQGELERAINKSCVKIPISSEDLPEAKEFAGKMEERFGKTVEIEKDLYGYHRVIRNIYIDDVQQLWIAATDKQGDLLDVYNDAGNLLAQCRPEGDDLFDRAHIQDGYIYSVIQNEELESFVLRKYKIVK